MASAVASKAARARGKPVLLMEVLACAASFRSFNTGGVKGSAAAAAAAAADPRPEQDASVRKLFGSRAWWDSKDDPRAGKVRVGVNKSKDHVKTEDREKVGDKDPKGDNSLAVKMMSRSFYSGSPPPSDAVAAALRFSSDEEDGFEEEDDGIFCRFHSYDQLHGLKGDEGRSFVVWLPPQAMSKLGVFRNKAVLKVAMPSLSKHQICSLFAWSFLAGWFWLLLVFCERKILLNDWLVWHDKPMRTGCWSFRPSYFKLFIIEGEDEEGLERAPPVEEGICFDASTYYMDSI